MFSPSGDQWAWHFYRELMRRVKLIRIIDASHQRYYTIELSQTLFGEMLLERVYWNIAFRSHTGKILKFIEDKNVARKLFESIIKQKLKRGYRLGE